MSIRKDLTEIVTVRNKRFQKSGYKRMKNRVKQGDVVRSVGAKITPEKKCNKNVIKMKKGVAICKHLCYNSGNLHKRKGVSVL